MQAFFVALFTSAMFTNFLSSLGFMGSCFEGSCGYAALLATIPLTLVTFPVWRYFSRRWAKGLQILIWLPIACLVSLLIFNEHIMIGLMLAILVWFGLEIRYIRQRGMPWKALFIRDQPVEKIAIWR